METAELDSMAVPVTGPSPVPVNVGHDGDLEVLRLVPSKGWRVSRLAEVWRCRELLIFLAWRDVKVRYKQTVFGAAWAVLQPAMMMLAFSVFFRRMAGISTGGIPYPLFVYAGLLPWTFFATAVNGAGNSVVTSAPIVTKIYFPRLLIPLASISTAAVDFCVAMGLMAILMCYYHIWGAQQVLLVPVIMLFIGAAAAGIGTFIAAMTVRYRDVKYVLPFMLQFWMFATPSVYMPTGEQKMVGLKLILAANPLTALIGAFRAACLGGPIHWSSALPAGLFGFVLLFVGCLYFQHIEDRFADEI